MNMGLKMNVVCRMWKKQKRMVKWDHRKYLCSRCTSARWKFRRQKRKTVKISLEQTKYLLEGKLNMKLSLDYMTLNKRISMIKCISVVKNAWCLDISKFSVISCHKCMKLDKKKTTYWSYLWIIWPWIRG